MEYKQGKENKVVDALSRRVDHNPGELAALTLPIPNWLDSLKVAYAKDLELQKLLQRMEQGGLDLNKYKSQGGLLYYKGRLYISSSRFYKLYTAITKEVM